MRSTINSTIRTAQRAGVVLPTHAVYARNELLTFSSLVAHGTATVVTSIPQVYSIRDSGTVGYASLRRSDGNAYIQVVDYSNSAHFALTGGTSVAYECMRNAVWSAGGGVYYAFSADMDASVTQIKRATLTATTDAPTLTWNNYGPTFNEGYLAGPAIVRRVEAVCPTAGGVVVAIGTHDFDQQLSTIQFYFLPDTSTVIALNTMIQMPLTETYVSWWGNAHHCTFISAIYNATTGRVHVFANDQVRGRAVTFSIHNGIESELAPVIPIAAEADLISLMPVSVSLINGLYYMTARFRRYSRQSTSTVQTSAFDCYLTSPDCINWSFGARSFYITGSVAYGTLIPATVSSTPYIYYAGNTNLLRAVATKIQASGSALETTLTLYLDNWIVEQAASAADSMRVTLNNPPVSGGTGVLDGNTNIKNGSVIYLESGQGATRGQIGVYGIDENSTAADADEGLEGIEIVARDYGSKRLIDTNLPLEIDLEGRITTKANLTSLEDLWIRTPLSEVELDEAGNELPFFGLRQTSTGGWLYTGSNDPVVAYAESGENGNVLMKTRVKCGVLDAAGTNYHLSNIGFLFGVSEAGEGNIVLIPKANGWTVDAVTQDRPKVRKLKLNATDPDDPEALDTGWNLKAGVNTLWHSNEADTIRTEAVTGGAYRDTLATSLTSDVTYEVAVRVSGRRVQVYWKPVNTTETAANWSDAAGYVNRGEYLFDGITKRSQVGRDWCGLAFNTDVPGSTDWFTQGQYGDIVTRMTNVNPLYSAPYDDFFTKDIGSCVFGTGSVTSVSLSGSYAIPVGSIILLLPVGASTEPAGVFEITSKTSTAQNSNFTVGFLDGLNSTSGSQTCHIFILGDVARYGYASSATRNKLIIPVIGEEYLEITDPGAIKNNSLLWARAAFLGEDNSAFTPAFGCTDGVVFDIKSAAADSGLAWSRATNPIGKDDSDVPLEGYSGSSPDEWRIMCFNGMLFEGDPVDHGLPGTGLVYFRVDQEIIAGRKTTFTLPGQVNTFTGCFIDTYYRPLSAVARNSSVLKGWRDPVGGVARPGDKFDETETTLGTVAGMLVEVISRNTETRTQDKQLYASDAYLTGSDDYLALTEAWAGELGELEAVAVYSRRGQDGTQKDTHDANAPVLYYPRDASGNTADIRISYFDVFSGKYQSVEDALKRLTNLAGVSQAAFRNRHTTPTADYTVTISTSAVHTIPTTENLANFCLDARVFIPGHNTNAAGVAGITSRNWIEFTFRGYYKIAIGMFATADQIAAGQYGHVRVGLMTTSGDINAGADGEKWLDWVPVALTDAHLSGTHTGTYPNYSITNNVDKLTDVRIAVQNNEVYVEMGGQHVWTFNLDRYVLSSGVILRVDTPGPITVNNKSTTSAYTGTFRVQELGEELPRYTAQMGSSVGDAVMGVTESRRVRWRATTDGGVEFSRFDVRDVADAFGNNLWRDEWDAKDLTQRAHVQVAGDNVAGESLSESLIGTDGYSFSSGFSDRVTTIEGASFEARLQQRETAEFAETREINGVGLLEVQPEDQLPLAYDGTGDAPIHTASNHVVTAVTLQTTLDVETGAHELTGRYTLRKFIS